VTGRGRAILGIDLGTNEVKSGLVTLDGRLLASARARYPTDLGRQPGWAEQDPGAWWAAVVETTRELAALDVADVVAVCADGHGPTLVAVDADGHATRPAITWLDTRAAAEADELASRTGVRGWALGGLPAALWLERHEPDVTAATTWYLTTWDYLAFRLTGVAASSLVADQLVPEAADVEAAGVPNAKLPRAVAAGTVVGELSNAAATATGLPAGTPVIGGTVDAFASYLGAGLLEPGDAYDPGGTAGGLGVYWDHPVEVQGAFVTPGPLPGLFSVGAAMAATGRALDWYRTEMLGGTVTTETLLREVAEIPAGADGLVFLPYLAGERSPLWDPTARGVLAGLTLGHRRGHVARAIVEASALALRHVAEPMLGAGITISELRVCGGPARSDTWNQIKADVTGFRVAVPSVLETGVVGSAILGAVGIGGFDDLRVAIPAMTAIDHHLEPRSEHAPTYDALYAAYRALYPATAPILRPLASAEPVLVR
jgi:xylulokinase